MSDGVAYGLMALAGFLLGVFVMAFLVSPHLIRSTYRVAHKKVTTKGLRYEIELEPTGRAEVIWRAWDADRELLKALAPPGTFDSAPACLGITEPYQSGLAGSVAEAERLAVDYVFREGYPDRIRLVI